MDNGYLYLFTIIIIEYYIYEQVGENQMKLLRSQFEPAVTKNTRTQLQSCRPTS